MQRIAKHQIELSDCLVIILAYNEEKSIAQTISSIYEGTGDERLRVKVYANGCTDLTHHVVLGLREDYPSLDLVILDRASKILAWNKAFLDNQEEFIVFADGDIIPEEGAVINILQRFRECPELILISCEQWPLLTGVGFQQKIVGVLQVPLCQDFLAGGFYGVRRAGLQAIFDEICLDGMPNGVVGEDAFLDNCIGKEGFGLAESRVYYTPPVFMDYFKYIGRLRWQNEQIALFSNLFMRGEKESEKRFQFAKRLWRKLSCSRSATRLLLGIISSMLRITLLAICRRTITEHYIRLGPVVPDGSWILSQSTRSASVK